jgi:iron-sulfur cluster repair protein YtfE (RIC family)
MDDDWPLPDDALLDEPSSDEPLFRELLMIHAMLRDGLSAVRDLADRTAAGADDSVVVADVEALARDSALWRLRSSCLYHCRFVHGHHSLEDAMLFPAVRAAAPGIAAEVDRLEADHRVVAEHLHAVEDAAAGLTDGLPGDRRRLVEALRRLESDLLDHLAREEALLRPVLREMRSFGG